MNLKMNVKMMAVVVLGLMLVLATATGASASEQDAACPICDFDMSTYDGPLSEAEIGGLLLALNDEYHAWAIYDQVIADFGEVRPFTNIRESEATHFGALVELFDAYEVPVPANPWPGNVPSFDSVTDACGAAVEAEVANMDLYTELYDTTEREDILTVYRSLQRASEEKHLPAFQRCSGDDARGANNGQRGKGRGQQEPRNGQGNGQQEPGNGQGAGQGNGQQEPGNGQGNGQGGGQQEPGAGQGRGQQEPGSGQCEPGTGRSGGRP